MTLERLQRYFSDFGERYGFRDMYTGGFYPYKTSEEHFLELGVGYNTPGIIKYPFWQMTELKEQYRGCCCNFKRTKNCYPSPVLHALKSVDTESGQITIPSSRTLSKEKEQTVYQEVNVP